MEENLQSDLLLKFGSIVSISHCQDNNSFIFTDGLSKGDVFLLGFSETVQK